MGSRGPKSAAAFISSGPNGRIVRPDVPYEIRDAQEARAWRAIVNSMVADYFQPTMFPLLIQLCRHTVAADRVAQLIEALIKGRKINCPEYSQLLKMQNLESEAIISLSRQLRLSPQSVYRGELAKVRPGASNAAAPWHRTKKPNEEDD